MPSVSPDVCFIYTFKKVTVFRFKSYFTINYLHAHFVTINSLHFLQISFCFCGFILIPFTSQQVQIVVGVCAESMRGTAARRYLSAESSSSGRDTYRAGSITFGIGLISVPSSCSMRCRANRSSYVIRLMAIPR